MRQHTLGPWVVHYEGAKVIRPKGNTLIRIAIVQRSEDARLIAAAPEIYDYLKTYAPISCIVGGAAGSNEEHCRCSGCWARALLAKIEGKE